jgi:nucleoside 2-deoxyribosyltransferase
MAGAVILCAGMLLPFSAYANDADYEANIAAVEAFKAGVVKNVGQGKKVYFASPMFNHAEKEFNLRITKVLEDYGYQVFLPQRDGIEAAKLEGKTEDELITMIFALDSTEVKKADIVFMNIDGRVPDEGACVELGMAYGIGKRCYGFKTDTHSVELGLDMNPMISGCMIRIFKNPDGDRLIEEIRQYLSENAL